MRTETGNTRASLGRRSPPEAPIAMQSTGRAKDQGATERKRGPRRVRAGSWPLASDPAHHTTQVRQPISPRDSTRISGRRGCHHARTSITRTNQPTIQARVCASTRARTANKQRMRKETGNHAESERERTSTRCLPTVGLAMRSRTWPSFNLRGSTSTAIGP